MKGSNTYIAACEGEGSGIVRTDDAGKTWTHLSQLNAPSISSAITGDINGDSCRMYVQTYSTSNGAGEDVGVYRSIDGGRYWQYLGGPGSHFDRRFCTLGRYIFAGDTLGNVWQFYDTIASSALGVIYVDSLTARFDTIGSCDTISKTVHWSNGGVCSSVSLSSITWDAKPLKNPFVIDSGGVFPRAVLPGATDSLTVRFANVGAGNFVGRLRLRFLLDGREIDTVISVSGIRPARPAAVLSTFRLDFDTVVTCTETRREAVLVNTSCDTESVSVTGLPALGFALVQPPTTQSVPPDDSVRIIISLNTQQSGAQSASLTVSAVPKRTGAQTFTIELSGIAEHLSPTPTLSRQNVIFDSVSYCDTTVHTVSLEIANPSSCDSLLLDSVWLGYNDFQLGSVLSGAHQLAPGDTETVTIAFRSRSRGFYRDSLHVRFGTPGSGQDSLIPISVFVYAGTGALATADSAIDFGTVHLCDDDRDTTISIFNPGCDTTVVDSITLANQGFNLVGGALPIKLPPGGSMSVGLQTFIDTTGGRRIDEDTLLVHANSNVLSLRIPLRRAFVDPSMLRLRLESTSGGGTAGDAVRYAVRVAGPLPEGLSQMDFDILLDSDLLSYSGGTGPNRVQGKDGHYTLTGNPLLTIGSDSSLAVLGFAVFLTKDSVTKIHLANARLNQSNNKYELCTATSLIETQALEYRYLFGCGQHDIQEYLRTGSFRIESITPNPTSGYAELRLMSWRTQSLKIEVDDALGAIVLPQFELPVSVGTNTVTINSAKLPSGTFFVRISSGLETWSQRLEVIR